MSKATLIAVVNPQTAGELTAKNNYKNYKSI
jgi:hypothetical protein